MLVPLFRNKGVALELIFQQKTSKFSKKALCISFVLLEHFVERKPLIFMKSDIQLKCSSIGHFTHSQIPNSVKAFTRCCRITKT